MVRSVKLVYMSRSPLICLLIAQVLACPLSCTGETFAGTVTVRTAEGIGCCGPGEAALRPASSTCTVPSRPDEPTHAPVQACNCLCDGVLADKFEVSRDVPGPVSTASYVTQSGQSPTAGRLHSRTGRVGSPVSSAPGRMLRFMLRSLLL